MAGFESFNEISFSATEDLNWTDLKKRDEISTSGKSLTMLVAWRGFSLPIRVDRMFPSILGC